ncbi:hypothetical protein M9Y10_003619 [Tritrichomonas musculus]|uniref:C2 domain-containing protein n=1 Tax=Tritrichomonas musculus TaxID=1915356 RepID=A0ABR2JQN1_9EUKA
MIRILHIRAIEAKDIPKMDVIGTADPFLLFKLVPSPEKYQTKVVKQNPNPVWNEEFHIPFEIGKSAILHMELYDWDKVSLNDLVSTRDFEIDKYEPGQVIDQWYDFFPGPGVKQPGKVHLVIHVSELDEEPFQTRQAAPQTRSQPEPEPEPEQDSQVLERDIDTSTLKEKYVEYTEPPLKSDATKEDKEEYDYNHKVRQLTQTINTISNGYLKPINFCYVDRLINIRGRKRPIAVFLKPVSSELSPSGVFIYDTTRMPKDKALYFFVGPESQKSLEQFGEKILDDLSKETKCQNIIRITDMKSPNFQKMVHQMGGNQIMILKPKNYGDELVFERSFFTEKLHMRLFEKDQKTTCSVIDFDSVPKNGVLVIDPSDFALYLYVDNIELKNDDEKKSLISAIEWMKNQPRFDKRELFVFDRSRIPSTVQLLLQ